MPPAPPPSLQCRIANARVYSAELLMLFCIVPIEWEDL